jgi:hypothetical protein
MNAKLVVAALFVFVNCVQSDGSEYPECIWHDPIKQADEWRTYHKSACKITIFKPGNCVWSNILSWPLIVFLEEETEEDHRYKYGNDQYSFNVYVSDKIGPHRKIPVTYHKK